MIRLHPIGSDMNPLTAAAIQGIDRDHLWHPYASLTAPLPTYLVRRAQGCRLELDAPRDGDGVDPRLVRQALAGTSAHCWVARAAGLGAFVMLGIDLDRVAPGRD